LHAEDDIPTDVYIPRRGCNRHPADRSIMTRATSDDAHQLGARQYEWDLIVFI